MYRCEGKIEEEKTDYNYNVKDLHIALVSLGLNILEQEVIDMTNTVARNGLVFFPEFCDVVLRKFREDNEEEFAEVMFKVGNIVDDILEILVTADDMWD